MEAAQQPLDADLIARHLGPDGRLISMPAKPSRRLLLRRYLVDAGLLLRPRPGSYLRPAEQA